MQHALFHHVCYRSFSFTELERLCKLAIIEASSRNARCLAIFVFALLTACTGEARVHFPNSGWYIEPANTAVPRRSSPTRAEFLRGTPLATGSERRRLNMSRLIKSNFDRHFLLFLTNILNISSPQERVTLEKKH